ncbi:MAG: TetR/AcrR family transcriptional regulator, partial [Cutibacterium avidum]|nr:TetR/AcrR family transcriptional regulator [Cutibacterium avidum]
EAGARASLGLSQLLGIFTARYVVGLRSLANLSASELIAREAPTLQKTLTGPASEE